MPTTVKDLVCGMEIEAETAAATSDYKGATYYFCAEGCKQEFDADPEKFLAGARVPMGEAPRKKWWEFWKV